MEKDISSDTDSAKTSSISLLAVDEVKVVSVVDNVADRSFSPLDDSEIVKRYDFSSKMYEGLLPIGEHGFCMYVDVKCGTSSGAVLFDVGVSQSGFIHNMVALAIQPSRINAVVISHGHTDHFKGLSTLIEKYALTGLDVVVHTSAFCERKFKESPNGQDIYLDILDQHELESSGFNVITGVEPKLLVDNMILVSGEIERNPEFENPLSYHYIKQEGNWKLDPSIIDEQCLIINVRGRGLVIITGCGHAGIVNIIMYAQQLTGINKILAVFGGFHLYHNKKLELAINALQKLAPDYVIPSHCTGWKAIHKIAKCMPEAFIQNAVGSTYTFSAI